MARAFLVFHRRKPRHLDGRDDCETFDTDDYLPTNYETLQREMQSLDRMTDARDERIQFIAQGCDKPVDDSGTLPYLSYLFSDTNLPGRGPDG